MTEAGSGVERLHELLIERALWGIHTGQARELAQLGAKHPDVDLEFVDKTVAALDAIELGPSPTLPDALRALILEEAPHDAAVLAADAPARSSVLPWVVAAACAVLAVIGWSR